MPGKLTCWQKKFNCGSFWTLNKNPLGDNGVMLSGIGQVRVFIHLFRNKKGDLERSPVSTASKSVSLKPKLH